MVSGSRALSSFLRRSRSVAVVVVLSLIAATLATVFPAFAAEPGLGRFRTVCDHSHFAQVDPIVNPGPPGTLSGHMHEFAANRSTDSDSTYESMTSADTNCELSADSAGYWIPALIGPDGQRVPMSRMTAYYSNRPVMASGQETIAFPPDFRMIAPAAYPHSYWNCVGDSDHSMSSRQSTPPDCGESELRLHVFFPSCWDGRPDSPDHMSHVAYGYRDGSVYGSPGSTEDYRIDACPSTHPLKIPQVRYRIVYPVSNGSQYTLADGTQLAHADFWNTWDQPTLEALVDQVLNSEVVAPDINDDNIDQFVDLSSPPPPPAPPSVSVVATDPDASEDGPDAGVFTVTRSGSTTDPLTVLYGIGGTATYGVDYLEPSGSVTIPAGASSAEVTLTPIDDSDAEEPETVLLSLLVGPGYTVGSPGSDTVTIADNDGSPPTPPPPPDSDPPTVTVAATDPDASEEGSDAGSFTFTRTGPTDDPLTVRYGVAGSADGSDYTGLSDFVVIPAGSSDVQVLVTPVDDSESEGPETVEVGLSDDPAYVVGSPGSATVTITDNDDGPPPVPPPPPPPPSPPSSIEYVGSGGVTSSARGIGTEGQVVDVPNLSHGDLMILVSHRNDDDGDFVTPDGWKRLDAVDGAVSSGQDRSTFIAWRLATSDEPASYTLLHTDNRREQWSSVIVAWRGVDPDSPFDVVPAGSHFSAVSSDPSPSNPSVAIQHSGALVVLISAITHDDITIGEAPDGYVMRVDHTGRSLDHRQIQIADRVVPTGNESAGDWLNTSRRDRGDSSVAVLALRPDG